MNVQTTTMDPRIALIHYKDYRKKCIQNRKDRLAAANAKITESGRALRSARSERTQIEMEDEILMLSYKALAKGARILNVAEVIRAAGFDQKDKLPKIAIAGADWKFCHLHIRDRFLTFAEGHWVHYNFRQAPGERNIKFMVEGFPAEYHNAAWRESNKLPAINGRVRAIVPSVPVHLRPGGDLGRYTILFEAKWENVPPIDPILLRHIAGNMYSVLAQWDLTDLERDVLEGRIS